MVVVVVAVLTLGLLRVYSSSRQWHPTPVLLPGKSHRQGSLVGCSPWGRWESDTTERLHFHFSLSCIGEGNGNPLECSCLENPRDGGAWWAAVYGVAQSRTRLKRLSSSSSISSKLNSRLNNPDHLLIWMSRWCILENTKPLHFSGITRKISHEQLHWIINTRFPVPKHLAHVAFWDWNLPICMKCFLSFLFFF